MLNGAITNLNIFKLFFLLYKCIVVLLWYVSGYLCGSSTSQFSSIQEADFNFSRRKVWTKSHKGCGRERRRRRKKEGAKTFRLVNLSLSGEKERKKEKGGNGVCVGDHNIRVTCILLLLL